MATNEELILKYRRDNSEETLNELIQQNMGFIGMIAKRYESSTDSYEDAVSDGVVGLIESIKHYDECKGKFLTYAYFHILKSIRQGRKNGSDYTSELARTIRHENPEAPLPDILKELKKTIPTVSKHYFLTAIQQDFSNNPNLSLDHPKAQAISINDDAQWQILHDLHQMTVNKPAIVRNIIILMSKGKTQKEICRTLHISRPTLIHKLKLYFPLLVINLKDGQYEKRP